MLVLTYVAPGGSEEQIVLDAASGSETGRVQITDHPVETGANPTDHVRVLPQQLRIEGILSDFPLTQGFAKTTVLGADRGPGRGSYLLAQLRALRDVATIFSVRTTEKVYESMFIESIDQPRDKSIAAAVRFTMSMKSVLFVDSQTVAVAKPTTEAGKQRTDGGHQTTSEATEGETKRVSLLKSAFKRISAMTR